MSCCVYVAVVVALYRDITMACLHDASMIAIGAAGAAQEQEEPYLHHVAPKCPYLMYRHNILYTAIDYEHTRFILSIPLNTNLVL